jgi:hypothetical protein
MKFTFKTDHPTGKYKSFEPDYHHIKLNKKDVGYISDEKPYKIRLQVIKENINENGNPNCVWKWATLKKQSETLQEAKDFLNTNFESITQELKLYKLGD